jgi:hypothetical protein
MQEELETDINNIARAEIIAHVEHGLSSGELSHESCPEIGAHDWERVEVRIKAILDGMTPSDEERTSSYERLVARCD